MLLWVPQCFALSIVLSKTYNQDNTTMQKIEDIQVFGVNMSFISLCEVKNRHS